MFTFHYSLPFDVMNVEANHHPSKTSGEIYLETDDGYFPCLGWRDRFLSVISHWIGNCIRMVSPNEEEQQETNYFMDGPYFFVVQTRAHCRINIRCMKGFDESEATEQIPSITLAFAEYYNALLSLTESIIKDPGFQWLETEQTRADFEQSVALLRASL